MASKNGHIEIASLLLQRGARVNDKDEVSCVPTFNKHL